MVASTRTTGSLPMSPEPKSVSSPQIATSTSFGTPNCRSIRDSRAACRCSICVPRLIRPAPTRVATYSSKVLRNVPRWRRSNASTAWSWLTPMNALEMTLCETPAAAASRDMLAMN